MSEEEDPDLTIIKARKMKELQKQTRHTGEDESKERTGKSTANRHGNHI